MDPSTLSQLLSRKRKLSLKTVSKICKKIGVNSQQMNVFLQTKNKVEEKPAYNIVETDIFDIVTDWYHFAILELSQLDSIDINAGTVSTELGISRVLAQAAIDRLLRTRLLIEEDGRLQKSHKNITNFSPGQTSAAHRLLQGQIIDKARAAVEDCAPEEKDITSIYMAIDEAKLPEARKMIAQFRRELCQKLEVGEPNRVYNMSIQLFPLSKRRRSHED